MSEPPSGTGAGTGSAGSLLRAARERQGLHIAALAAAIKVSQRKLEALEADRYDQLPDATFTRALAQTVCRTLKVDARPVLELLPPAPFVALTPNSGGLNTPFRERPGREEPGLAGPAMRPMVWAAAALALAALAVLLAPASWWSLLRGGASPALPAPTPALLPASAPVDPAAPMDAPEPASAASAAGVAGSSAAGGLPTPAPTAPQALVETGSATQAPPPVAGAPSVATPAPAAAANGLVQLRTSAASWVEVRDAREQLLLSRIVQPGETVGLNGSLPMRLVIGNAAVTQLAFRGQPVDLAPSTRDNVARVELR